ncbi:hypothetical protein SDC9_155968 [bioreactor metagenome]|uniref:Uncharacterized protein n=1 Tax=bioreactor metagenome TaxID=1076179 RepID=A0A645F873_9ZZZZ
MVSYQSSLVLLVENYVVISSHHAKNLLTEELV